VAAPHIINPGFRLGEPGVLPVQRQAEPWADDIRAQIGLMHRHMKDIMVYAFCKYLIASRLDLGRGQIEIVVTREGFRITNLLAIHMHG